MVSGEIIPLSAILKRSGVTLPALRARLYGLDAQIGGGLIVRFTSAPRSRVYVDKAKLRQHCPGYLPDDPEPATGVHEKLDDISGQVKEVQDDMKLLLEMATETLKKV